MDFQVSPELVAIYLEDARGHLEALDRALLDLERDGLRPETITTVLGPLHTLKGNSGMMGFVSMKDYVHTLEDAFARLRDGRLPLTQTVCDTLFAGANALRDSVEAACDDAREVRDLGKERRELEALFAGAAPQPVPAPIAATPPRPTAPAQPPVPAAAAMPVPAAPLDLSADPDLAVMAEGGPDAAQQPSQTVTRSGMVRVDFAQLDHLLNLVGELIVYRTKLQEVEREVGLLLPGHDASRALTEAIHQVAAVSAQLQEATMDVRMLPIRTVFHRFPRLVRDIARHQRKRIELVLQGEETRVDKAVIDEIGEPLVHMIRNAVDHGIEAPDVRVAHGKSPTGTILLSAAQESSYVVITIMDDGGGIDVDEVRRRAIARGLIRADDHMGDRELIQFIFGQGFSTARAVTDLSGRGVGLDVVMRAIERLSGLIEAESVRGAGTKFTIRLPLTLAIIPALMVEVSGRRFAIPLASVVESLKFSEEAVNHIGGLPALRIRERIVPIVRLADVFGLPEQAHGPRTYAVVLGRGERRLAVVVERLRGQQEIVIKALDAAVQAPGVAVAGATIMGDGSVVLIVDVAALFEGRRGQQAPGA
jgi:two-component system chemotaxis sensor kinase CheA